LDKHFLFFKINLVFLNAIFRLFWITTLNNLITIFKFLAS